MNPNCLLFSQRERERERERERRRRPVVSNVSDMTTPFYNNCLVYSKVSAKHACRSVDSDLTTHYTIQFHDGLLLY